MTRLKNLPADRELSLFPIAPARFVTNVLRSVQHISTVYFVAFLCLAPLACRETTSTTELNADSGPSLPDQAVVSLAGIIGAEAGYLWEHFNTRAQVYTVIMFGNGSFRLTAYHMEDGIRHLTKLMSVDGQWTHDGKNGISARIDHSPSELAWSLDENRTTLNTGNGMVFRRLPMVRGAGTRENPESMSGLVAGSVDGTYFSATPTSRLVFTIVSDSWTATSEFISGFGQVYDIGAAGHPKGIVRGNKLFDGAGKVQVGRVEGGRLIATYAGRQVVLNKE